MIEWTEIYRKLAQYYAMISDRYNQIADCDITTDDGTVKTALLMTEIQDIQIGIHRFRQKTTKEALNVISNIPKSGDKVQELPEQPK